jgi:hypothetical protein
MSGQQEDTTKLYFLTKIVVSSDAGNIYKKKGTKEGWLSARRRKCLPNW